MVRNRITYFFTNNNGAGWSETYYTNAPTLGLALAAGKVLLPARVGLLGRGAVLRFIRVSDDLIARDSQIYPVPVTDGEVKQRSAGDADIANNCVDVRIEATDLKRRTLFLRGIPDGICLDNGRLDPTPAWTANFLIFSQVLLSGAFAVRVRINSGLPNTISNVSTVGPTGLVTITTVANHGFSLNNVVNIRGVIGATQVRGLQKVNSVTDATNFVIRVNRVVKPYLGGGNVVKNDYELIALTNVVAVRCSHHNAGRPFDSPRGRRLVR
jgi:hypothetical protein